MLNWRNHQKSEAVEQAEARARERARLAREEQDGMPNRDGLVVEEISPEEFMRLFQQHGGKAA